MKCADRLTHAGQHGFLFCKFASALIRAEQISAFHQGKARAALAIASNLASRANRKVALANPTKPFELWRVIPDIAEPLAPQVTRGLGQLHAGKDIAIGRNVATIVAGAARKIFVGRAFDSAGDRAPERGQ